MQVHFAQFWCLVWIFECCLVSYVKQTQIFYFTGQSKSLVHENVRNGLEAWEPAKNGHRVVFTLEL